MTRDFLLLLLLCKVFRQDTTELVRRSAGLLKVNQITCSKLQIVFQPFAKRSNELASNLTILPKKPNASPPSTSASSPRWRR